MKNIYSSKSEILDFAVVNRLNLIYFTFFDLAFDFNFFGVSECVRSLHYIIIFQRSDIFFRCNRKHTNSEKSGKIRNIQYCIGMKYVEIFESIFC